jgi:ribosomal protein S27AE
MPSGADQDNISTHPIYCPRCGKPLDGFVVLTGEKFLHRYDYNHASYGPCTSQKCWVCDYDTDYFEEILEDEPLPSPKLCPECQIKYNKADDIVKAGGIHFICEDCNAMETFPPGEYASKIRKERGLSPSYTDIRIVLTRENCPVCGPNVISTS